MHLSENKRKYNIKSHVEDHADFIIDHLSDKDEKLIHFNTSVDLSYFIENGKTSKKEIDRTMIKIFKNVLKTTVFAEEKNGTYTKKDGTKVQRDRKRKIKLDNDILGAYHSRHFDGSKSVNPHFHFLIGKKARVGRNFMYLKQALEKEAKKENIKFNFMEQRQVTGLSKKQLYKIESLSWIMQQGNLNKIKKYMANESRLRDTLDLLTIHYKNTENISYFIKIQSIVNQRLKELNTDYIYKGINLKNDIYFFLSDLQYQKLKNLSQSKSIKLNLGKVIDREILKYAYGYKSDAMEILIDKFKIKKISHNQLFYGNRTRKKLMADTKEYTFRNLIIKDARRALAYAASEKVWKNILLEMGYTKVSIKSAKKSNGKREKIGLNFVTKKKTKIFISFSDMSLTGSRITSILLHNTKRKRNKHIKLESYIDDYQTSKIHNNTLFSVYKYRMKVLLQIYSKEQSKQIDLEKLKHLSKLYDVQRSDMYRITTLINETTTIVDNTSKITLAKSTVETKKNDISDMLDLAEFKGWDLDDLHIEGSEEFKKEIIRQIGIRKRNEIKIGMIKKR